MNLVSLLEKRAAEHPDRPALVDCVDGRDRVASYGDLMRRVSAGAAFLEKSGMKRGQTVLVFHPVSIELYESLLASFHFGLRVMLADPSAGKGFISLCCGRLMPDAFFGSWKAQWLRVLVPELRGVKRCFRRGAWFPGSTAWSTAERGISIHDAGEDEPALITFTSGSTGVPKAAVRTHGFLLAQHRALAKSLDFQEGEVDLITLPVFVLANLASGLTSVLAATDLARPGSPDVAAVRAQCGRQGVTRCAASPAFFEGLLREGALPDLRKVYTGGAPVFPDLLRRLEAALPSAEIHSVFGSTEAEPIAHHRYDEADAGVTRDGGGLCAGLPVEEIELRILEDHWGVPLGPMDREGLDQLTIPGGQAGEIVVSGDHVLPGYLGGAGDEETKIRVDGRIWHRTGDAGWVDELGRLWLLGRCAEKMKHFPAKEGLPGEALRYPFAVESAMRERFPEVRMAALDCNGARTLVVEGNRQSVQEAAAELGMEQVIMIDKLPLDRRHQAKIDYPELRRQLGARR
jgi:acyl-CoA synthetase (AMP-forming)/AMP-acid ligase II